MSEIDWDSRFWSKVHPEALSGCWLWHASVKRGGYGLFGVGSRTDGTRRVDVAHRHAYELANGPIPAGLIVRHKCDVPACVNPDHLEIGTQHENIRDMVRRGRSRNRQSSVRLTSADRAAIVARKETGEPVASIAAEYGISLAYAYELGRRKPRRCSRGVGGGAVSAVDLAAALEAVRLGEATGEHAAVLAAEVTRLDGCQAAHRSWFAALEEQRSAVARLAEVSAERDRLTAEVERIAGLVGTEPLLAAELEHVRAERDRLLAVAVAQAAAWDAALAKREAGGPQPREDNGWILATVDTEELGRELRGAR